MSLQRSIAGAMLVAALLAGCAVHPRAQTVDALPVDVGSFAGYRTFGFADQGTPSDSEYASVLTMRLQQAARSALETQGYTYTEASPDLRVNVQVVVESRPEILDPGFMRRWPYAPELGTYKLGLLGVDLVDAKKSAVVWQGVARSRLEDDVLDDRNAAVERAMARMFASFPKAATP